MEGPPLDRKSSSESLVRTRTWSVDMQKHWSLPVPVIESIEQRIARYTEYFTLKDEQVNHISGAIYNAIKTNVRKGGRLNATACVAPPAPGATNGNTAMPPSIICGVTGLSLPPVRNGCGSLKMLDTCVKSLPSGTEKGLVYTVEFSITHVHAVRCRVEGNRTVSTTEHRMPHNCDTSKFAKGVLDAECGAMELFDSLAECVRILMESSGDRSTKSPNGLPALATGISSITMGAGTNNKSPRQSSSRSHDKSSSSPARHQVNSFPALHTGPTATNYTSGPSHPIPVAFIVPFPCEQKGIRSANLLAWTKGFETGRRSADPVEGLDLSTLLDMAFWRKDLNARCVTVVNDGTAALIAAEFERPPRLPPCVVSYLCSVGVNGVYVEPDHRQYQYEGCIINTELGDFDQSLPVTDVDLEVDFADQGGHGQQIFEKMSGGGYLGEVCRRLIVKVFQEGAPPLAWARQSLPTAAAALCIQDKSEDLNVMRQILEGLWKWGCDETTTPEQPVEDTAASANGQDTASSTMRPVPNGTTDSTVADTKDAKNVQALDLSQLLIIKDLFKLVFDRSAALSAAAISALARATTRLQPAMGGCTVALESALHSNYPWYTELIRQRLTTILQFNASLVNLYVVHHAAAKGAAVLACMPN